MSCFIIWQRSKIEDYKGNASWNQWEVLAYTTAKDAERRLKYWIDLNDYAVKSRGKCAKSEFMLLPDGETPDKCCKDTTLKPLDAKLKYGATHYLPISKEINKPQMYYKKESIKLSNGEIRESWVYLSYTQLWMGSSIDADYEHNLVAIK